MNTEHTAEPVQKNDKVPFIDWIESKYTKRILTIDGHGNFTNWQTASDFIVWQAAIESQAATIQSLQAQVEELRKALEDLVHENESNRVLVDVKNTPNEQRFDAEVAAHAALSASPTGGK